jgi:hypothetical protein
MHSRISGVSCGIEVPSLQLMVYLIILLLPEFIIGKVFCFYINKYGDYFYLTSKF